MYLLSRALALIALILLIWGFAAAMDAIVPDAWGRPVAFALFAITAVVYWRWLRKYDY